MDQKDAGIVCRLVGVVRSRFATPEGIPIQTASAPRIAGADAMRADGRMA
ncbi:hypothetical protein [Pseudorhodoferax sp. Leaf274]|nr:hypothetical protein [Pseudorhodoferax sp. Leaf274]